MHTWGNSDGPGGIRLSFILSVSGFVIPIAIILLALRPPAEGISPRFASSTSARSFQTKMAQLEQAVSKGEPAEEVHLSAAEIGSAIAQTDSSDSGTPPAVSLHDDVVTGQFLTKVAGQQVYVTVSGHLAAKDGYVNFDPTEFEVGDLSIPVVLVNPALQKKIEEQREQLKLPPFVSDLRVENGEVVIRVK